MESPPAPAQLVNGLQRPGPCRARGGAASTGELEREPGPCLAAWPRQAEGPKKGKEEACFPGSEGDCRRAEGPEVSPGEQLRGRGGHIPRGH